MLSPDCVKRFAIGGKTLIINEKIIPDSARAAKDVASWCKKGQPIFQSTRSAWSATVKGDKLHKKLCCFLRQQKHKFAKEIVLIV